MPVLLPKPSNTPDESKDEWETPEYLFNPLHARFNFTIDVAASAENHKLPRYYTQADDGMRQSWVGERVWCNPPYSNYDAWLRKAASEPIAGDDVIVMLIPGAIEKRVFHEIAPRVSELWALKARVNFVGYSKNSPNFPSVLLVFYPGYRIVTKLRWYDPRKDVLL